MIWDSLETYGGECVRCLKAKVQRSLQICGAVNLQELLFGSQEDVGLESEGPRG